jgi:hypothetical protein
MTSLLDRSLGRFAWWRRWRGGHWERWRFPVTPGGRVWYRPVDGCWRDHGSAELVCCEDYRDEVRPAPFTRWGPFR